MSPSSGISCESEDLQEGQPCVPDGCLIDRASCLDNTSPHQASSSLCGVCWNISRIIALDMKVKNETIRCFRNDHNCLTKATTNHTVWMYGDEYFMDRPSPDRIEVIWRLLIPLSAAIIPFFLSVCLCFRTISKR